MLRQLCAVEQLLGFVVFKKLHFPRCSYLSYSPCNHFARKPQVTYMKKPNHPYFHHVKGFFDISMYKKISLWITITVVFRTPCSTCAYERAALGYDNSAPHQTLVTASHAAPSASVRLWLLSNPSPHCFHLLPIASSFSICSVVCVRVWIAVPRGWVLYKMLRPTGREPTAEGNGT